MKAFFSIHLVMGLHPVSSMRDCWSSDPILQVPYIAHCQYHANEKIWRVAGICPFQWEWKDDQQRWWEPWPSIQSQAGAGPFEQLFLEELVSSTKRQAIDAHMIKYKGHSILKQYEKGKPIKSGFKLWCRCDSKSGYFYEFRFVCRQQKRPHWTWTGRGCCTLAYRKAHWQQLWIFYWQFFQFTTAAAKFVA